MNIVITGASKGLGRSTAEIFAKDEVPHVFFLCARNGAELETAGKELEDSFPHNKIYTKACDVSDKASLQQFVQWIMSYTAKVDILVNNAGIYLPGNIYAEDDDILEKMMAINLYGAYHLTRMILPGMINAKPSGGHIFNTCSIGSVNAVPGASAYSISKFALHGFSKNLREEMKPHGIKVTQVLSGSVFTDSWKGSTIDPKKILEMNDVAKMIYAAAQLSPQACVEEIIIQPLQPDLSKA